MHVDLSTTIRPSSRERRTTNNNQTTQTQQTNTASLSRRKQPNTKDTTHRSPTSNLHPSFHNNINHTNHITMMFRSSRYFAFPVLLVLLVLLLAVSMVSANTRHLQRDERTGHLPSSAEELLTKQAHRREEFTNRLEEYKLQKERHEQGHLVLQEFEVERINRKIKAYTNKLDYLNKEFDDFHLKRLLGREEMLNEIHGARIDRRSEL